MHNVLGKWKRFKYADQQKRHDTWNIKTCDVFELGNISSLQEAFYIDDFETQQLSHTWRCNIHPYIDILHPYYLKLRMGGTTVLRLLSVRVITNVSTE